MQIGIGLPITIPGVHSDLIFEWARQADISPFSTLGVLDRLVYSNYEPLIALAAAAACTRRIRLMTTILIGPLRQNAILAKQAASIDALSGGRLSLGIAVGGREDDYQAALVSFHNRGKLFDEQLTSMKRIWKGEPINEAGSRIGPLPARAGGPELLIGGNTPAAIERVGQFGDGFIVGGGGPAMAEQGYKLALASWQAAGRAGKPRFVTGMYFALGPNAQEKAGSYLHDYYSFMGQIASAISQSLPTTAEAVKAGLETFQHIGVDEVILWPTIADIEQLHGAAEIANLFS